MKVLEKLKLLKNIDPWAAGLGLVGYTTAAAFGQFPLASLSAPQIALFVASQTVGLGAMVASFHARTLESPREKFAGITVAAGLNTAQFGLLLAAGFSFAIGSIVSMSIACLRSATFFALTDKQTKTHKLPRKTVIGIAAGFVAAGWTYMFTGFGIKPPVVQLTDLMQFKSAAVGVCLPMAASVCGAFANTKIRTRDMRPWFTGGGSLNIAYNLGFSGALLHLVSEAGASIMMVRQAIKQDMPARVYKGEKLTWRQRFKMYRALKKDVSLSETYYEDSQKMYEYIQKNRPSKIVMAFEKEGNGEQLLPIGCQADGLLEIIKKYPTLEKDTKRTVLDFFKEESLATLGYTAKSFTKAARPQTNRPDTTYYVFKRNPLSYSQAARPLFKAKALAPQAGS